MADENFERTSAAFLAWFKSLPGATFSDSIAIGDLRHRNAGRGIVAVSDIAAEETLFKIPRSSIMSIETSQLPKKLPEVFENGADGGAEDSPQLDNWSALILVMVYEYLQGTDSSWKPYFDILPKEFDTPMFWDEGQLSELQASPLRAKVGKQEAEDMFRSNIIPVIRQHSVLFPSSDSLADEAVISLAHRMGTTIMACAFDLENDDEQEEDEADGWVEDNEGKTLMGLVPMADIMNSDAEFNAHVNHSEECLEVLAVRGIKTGEEVLNYYGPHPNSELLRRYGYVTEKHSRYDVAELPWELIKCSCAEELGVSQMVVQEACGHLDEDELEDTFVFERSTGEPSSEGIFTQPATFEEPPEDLQQQLKALLKAIKKVAPSHFSEKRKRDEVQSRIIGRALRSLLSQYRTTALEDQRLLETGSLGGKQHMAVVVRLGEKRVIEEAIARLAKGDSGEASTQPRKQARDQA